MDARDYLRQIQLLDIKIDQRLKELDKLKTDAYSVRGLAYDKDPVQNSPRNDQMINAIVKIQEQEKTINDLVVQLTSKRNVIIGEIHGLNDCRYLNLLYKRYVEYKHIDQIAREMNYDYDWTKQLHLQALQAFEDTYHISGKPVILTED